MMMMMTTMTMSVTAAGRITLYMLLAPSEGSIFSGVFIDTRLEA
jgi:hypothetical protein